MGFTPAELAEMARADAEIETSFRITNEDIALGRELDREAVLECMDPKKRKVAESQRRYREANKEKVAESRRRYYEANKEKVAESQRRYREANKEKVAESQRAIRELRRSLGLTQDKFSALLGVPQCTVSFWENVKAPENWREICENYKGEVNQ